MNATSIFLPLQCNRHNNIEEIVFAEWNMEDGTFVDLLTKRYTCQNTRSQHVDFYLDLPRDQVVIIEVFEDGNNVAVVNLRDDVIKWNLSNTRQFRPQLRGFGVDYLSIFWMGRLDAGLRIYRLVVSSKKSGLDHIHDCCNMFFADQARSLLVKQMAFITQIKHSKYMYTQ